MSTATRYTPDIGNIGVKDLHCNCDVRVWMDLVGGEVKVAFRKEPQARTSRPDPELQGIRPCLRPRPLRHTIVTSSLFRRA